MKTSIRQANQKDAQAVTALVHELAASEGDPARVDEAYAAIFLETPGCGALLAEIAGRPVGLLSYTLRPDLYHAGLTGLIQELVVTASERGKGIGGCLLESFMQLMEAQGTVEISVGVMPGNRGAIAFYKRHGLLDESLNLEKHL